MISNTVDTAECPVFNISLKPDTDREPENLFVGVQQGTSGRVHSDTVTGARMASCQTQPVTRVKPLSPPSSSTARLLRVSNANNNHKSVQCHLSSVMVFSHNYNQ